MAFTVAVPIGCTTCVPSLGMILPCAVATISTRPSTDHASACAAKAISSHIATLGAGDTACCCKDSAAGRNSASSLR